jgi:hypothetical protein
MTRNLDKIANEKKLREFVPMQAELIQLVKYWVRKAIDDDHFSFWAQCVGSSDLRHIDFDWKRVNEIAQKLGKAETDKAVNQAYEDAAQSCERNDWIAYRYGTGEERTIRTRAVSASGILRPELPTR